MPHTYINITDFGQTVICDLCNADWTNRPESGGFLFTSKAYCPKCAVETLKSIQDFGEEKYIKAHCPPELSFAAWVLKLRGGDNSVRIITQEPDETT